MKLLNKNELINAVESTQYDVKTRALIEEYGNILEDNINQIVFDGLSFMQVLNKWYDDEENKKEGYNKIVYDHLEYVLEKKKNELAIELDDFLEICYQNNYSFACVENWFTDENIYAVSTEDDDVVIFNNQKDLIDFKKYCSQ